MEAEDTASDELRHSSDFLDSLPVGEPCIPGTANIQLVSLGCSCGPKLTFQSLGYGAESLPFDWVRTRVCGILHFMRNDFTDFYEYFTRTHVPDSKMIMYRSFFHSFWHDNPNDPGMREKYERRAARFRGLGSDARQLLFVRSVASTDEICQTDELLEELLNRFGNHARLLLIVDFQTLLQGPAIVEGLEDHLLVYLLAGAAHRGNDGTPSRSAYARPLRCALAWVLGEVLEEAECFSSFRELAASVEETHCGLTGPAGLRALEERPEGPEEVLPAAVARECEGPRPAEPPALPAVCLDKGHAWDEGGPVLLASLGCDCGPKRTLLAMGGGAEALPFDWVQVSLEGLLHFVGPRGSDFQDFFEYHTRKPVPGTALTMYRSPYHSFWNDNPESETTRAEYAKRIDRFRNLAGEGKPTLFVRAVATTDELSSAEELLAVLLGKFGSQAKLLLIVDFQESSYGPCTVAGCPGLLIHFLHGTAHSGDSRDAPYREPITAALALLRSAQPAALHLEGPAAAAARAKPATHWGLVGPGGLRAFAPAGAAPPRRPPTEEELRTMAEIAAGVYPMMGRGALS